MNKYIARMMTYTAEQITHFSYRGKTTVQRFWEKVDKRGSKECWLWRGALNNGYGSLRIREEGWSAHRFSWVIHNGNVPQGLYTLHKCDVRNCVNPNHLFLGTYQDNTLDSVRKGRWIKAHGSAVGTSKLTEQQVLDIRKMFSEGTYQKRALARMFHISDTMVGKIVRREFWKYI